jgi:ribosomal protein S18 acetylase RimI-like enzyme
MLDHCIWNALSTRHVSFAEGDESAKRYPPAVTALAAIRDFSSESFESLARVMALEDTAIFFLDSLPVLPVGWRVVRDVPLAQMVWSGSVDAQDENGIERLSIADVDEMLALTELTKPGPFGKRTPELGTYLGIRDGGRLVAMAGERLRLPGFTEVSAVCTHPEYQGRGFARMLISAVVRRIAERGETPFLHVAQVNARAIRVYEELGFKTRILQTAFALQREAKLGV